VVDYGPTTEARTSTSLAVFWDGGASSSSLLCEPDKGRCCSVGGGGGHLCGVTTSSSIGLLPLSALGNEEDMLDE